jgi:hypothetical protein
MKTPVQQLIDYMKANFHLTDESRQEFEKAKEAEKKEIINAANQDEFEDLGGITKGEYYYHKTYK